MLGRIPTVRPAIGGNKDTTVRRSSKESRFTVLSLRVHVHVHVPVLRVGIPSIYLLLLLLHTALRQEPNDPVLGFPWPMALCIILMKGERRAKFASSFFC